jgi:bile acid-coenzyme A ligase
VAGALISYGERLHRIAMAQPTGLAIIFAAEDGTESQCSWGDLDSRSTQLARVLQRRGVSIGDRVAVQLRNSPEFVIGCFAAWKAGATAIPARWDLPEWELERVRSVIDAAVEIRPETLDIFAEANMESADAFDFPEPPVAQGICSSGATGTPKVIIRNTPAIWSEDARSTAIAEAFGAVDTVEQRSLVCGPMYHTNGFIAISDLLSGFSVILLERFNAGRAVDLIERHRPTGMVAATPLLQRIAQVPDVTGRDFSSLQWVLQGAALLPEWVARTWFELIGPERMILLYGSTEAAGVVAIRGDEYLQHPGTIGKGFGGTGVKILRPDGDEAAPNEVGEIYMRPGDGVLIHKYLGDVPQTPVTADGYTTIGDLGWIDDEGYLYIADRRVDLIKSGGANVFPAEVEAALSEHPGISDVVVLGLPDEEWGKRVHAVVQRASSGSSPGEAEIIGYAKARLAPYKVPKSVEFVEEIPRSEAGKVYRGAMIAERSG